MMISNTFEEQLLHARKQYGVFLESMRKSPFEYTLAVGGEVNPFALCFAIYGWRLIGREHEYLSDKEKLASVLRSNLRAHLATREAECDIRNDKSAMQLLCFTLSALDTLKELDNDPLEDIVTPLLPWDVHASLDSVGALDGLPKSGNQALFMAVLLLHARMYLKLDVSAQIEEWIALHFENMNERGFWGDCDGMTYLQFQNGYHQYEVFDYLDLPSPRAENAALNTASLVGYDGHFAPFPGGTGCYDYDASFFLLGKAAEQVAGVEKLLERLADNILVLQNADGGFGENASIRPRSVGSMVGMIRYGLGAQASAKKEVLTHCLYLSLPRHDLFCNNWSPTKREWSDSDLWNSWFRMLTLANIQQKLCPEIAIQWGFLQYPGVGFKRETID